MSKYDQLPCYIKLLIVFPLGIIFSLYTLKVMDLPWDSVYKYIMMLFYVPVYSLAFMPLLTLIKVADFKSELLFITKDKKNNYEIHFGSFFDCLLSGLFTNKNARFKDEMMYQMIQGLQNIITDVEDGNIDRQATIVGSSYFFDERTASKFGFSATKTKYIHQFIIILNIVEITLVYSFAQGRIAIPNFSDFKTVKTTGAKLVAHKTYVTELVDRLSMKV